MSNIIDICGLRVRLLFKNAVLTLPAIATVGFLGIMYASGPLSVSSSFVVSGVFLFFVFMFISMGINVKEDDIFEETLLLHSRSAANYYISRELLLFLLNIVFSLIVTVYPVIVYLADKARFARAIEPVDVICGGAVIFLCGITGMEMGDLFHPRIIQRRRDAILFAALVSVLSISKFGLIEYNPFFKVLDYLLPPVLDAYKMVAKDVFKIRGIVFICLHMLIYAAVIMLIKIRLLTLKKYRY